MRVCDVCGMCVWLYVGYAVSCVREEGEVYVCVCVCVLRVPCMVCCFAPWLWLCEQEMREETSDGTGRHGPLVRLSTARLSVLPVSSSPLSLYCTPMCCAIVSPPPAITPECSNQPLTRTTPYHRRTSLVRSLSLTTLRLMRLCVQCQSTSPVFVQWS